MSPPRTFLFALLLPGCEVLKGAPSGGTQAFDTLMRGMVLAHIDDDDDDDPGNDGARGFGTEASARSVTRLAELGVDALSLSAYGLLDHTCDADIRPEWDAVGQESDDALTRQILQAHAAGMRVLLSPTLYVEDPIGWRGALGQCPDGSRWSAEDWDRFEVNYLDFVLHWADFAEAQGVALFSIGVELASTTAGHPEILTEGIAQIRGRYTGALTYTANWDEVVGVPFWGDLDVIGINAFFPLTGMPDAGLDTLTIGARAVRDDLAILSADSGRSILFTEVGYKSHPDSAIRPWEWPEDVDTPLVDQNYQADCYTAVFEAFWDQPWFAGLFWWKWFADSDDARQNLFTVQEGPHGFTPMDKRAEDVVGQWYSSP